MSDRPEKRGNKRKMRRIGVRKRVECWRRKRGGVRRIGGHGDSIGRKVEGKYG